MTTIIGYILQRFAKYKDFPTTGEVQNLYLDESNYKAYFWTGSNYLYFGRLDENLISQAEKNELLDVENYANTAAFPTTGEEGKIYISEDTNKLYRWDDTGGVYNEVGGTAAGGGDINTTAKSSDYNASNKDFVLMTTGATNKKVVLPAAASSLNFIIDAKKVDSGKGYVQVETIDAAKIDGKDTAIIKKQWDSITVVCDGVNWFIK